MADTPEKELASIQIDNADEAIAVMSGDRGTPEVYLLAAQAHATLALVEATERLAEAQETANLIARLSWAMNMTAAEYNGLAKHSREETERSAEEIARRLSGYRS